MRSALRWTSLGIVAAALYWLGAQGFHHRHFLAIVPALAAAVVLIFIVTDAGDSQD